MRAALALAFILCTLPAPAQQTTLTVRSNLVEVPVLVKTKSGQNVYELTARDFLLTDNGVPQRLTLDPDTDSQPLALAIVVETGGAGARHLADYSDLDSVLDALIGNVPHHVAVVSFDSAPHLLLPFTPRPPRRPPPESSPRLRQRLHRR